MERIKNSHLENQLDLLNDFTGNPKEMFGDNGAISDTSQSIIVMVE